MNGVSIFAKGSNFIPAHILPELGAERTRLHRILTSARDANMNMLRVWGGGLYESDTFYEVRLLMFKNTKNTSGVEVRYRQLTRGKESTGACCDSQKVTHLKDYYFDLVRSSSKSEIEGRRGRAENCVGYSFQHFLSLPWKIILLIIIYNPKKT